MFQGSAPLLSGAAAETDFTSFGTGFDFVSPFGHTKNAMMASPNTDSLEGDLSTSSGGVLRESLPQSYLTPSSTHMSSAGTHGGATSAAGRHLSIDMRAVNAMAHSATTATTPSSAVAGNYGEGSPLFQFASTNKVHGSGNTVTHIEEEDDDDDDAEVDSGLLDYAGLESLLMAAVGDQSNTPTPTHGSAAAATTTTTTAVSTSPQTVPFAVSSESRLPKKRSTNSVSPVPSHGSNSAVQGGGGSPNTYSGEGTFLYSNFGPEVLSSLPVPHTLPSNVNVTTAESPTLDTTSPLVLPVAPPGTTPSGAAAAELSSGVMNSSCTASHSVTSTCGSVSMGLQPSDAEVRSNLFICGLPVTVTDKDLFEIFGKFGPIESAKVMLDIHTGRSRGIAFVKFSNVEHAENAVDTTNGTMINGHPITVRVANSRAAYLPGNPTNKTFVRNVPLAVSRSTLMDYFSQFGEVTDLSIKSDTAQGRHHLHHHGSRSLSSADDLAEEKLNIVFITYSTKEAAARAAEATHTKAPFKECNGVPLLAKVAEDTMRRMERLSRRARGGPGADGKELNGSSTTSAPLSYGAVPGVQPGMVMPAVVPVTAAGGYAGATYVTVPGLASSDLSALTIMPAGMAGSNPPPPPPLPQPQRQPQQMSVFRDASGNLIYASAVPRAAQPGVTYSVQSAPQPPQSVYVATQPQPQQPHTMYIQTANGLVASQAPQLHVVQQCRQPLQQQQQLQPMQLSGAQGQLMYMQTSNGSLVPVVFGGAASAGSMQPQGMNSYYVMTNN